MTENSFIMDIREKVGKIERKNHYVSNILLVSTFVLIILFTLFSGVNVNLSSKYTGDGEADWVRQSSFQLIDVMFNSTMNREEALEYVESVSAKLSSYGVLPPATGAGEENMVYPQHSLDFTELIAQAKDKMGGEVSKINWIKYKYALSVVVGNPSLDSHKANWDGHVAIMLAGQSIFEAFVRIVMLVIAMVMLVFATISLIKKKKFARGRLSLILMLICFFGLTIFNFGFIKSDACSTIVMILIPLSAVLYALLEHCLLPKHEFSFTQFVYNGVMLAGSVLVFVFMLLPMFKVTDTFGTSLGYGWNFLYDLLLGEGAYLAVPMSYFLQAFIMSGLLILHIVLCSIMIITLMNRFMSANYQHNDKKVSLIAIGSYGFIISLLIIVSSLSGSLKISSLDLVASVNYFLAILPLLLVGGLLAFAYLYKPTPIKKELAILASPNSATNEDKEPKKEPENEEQTQPSTPQE